MRRWHIDVPGTIRIEDRGLLFARTKNAARRLLSITG
jgi:hypothetical protein